jgi:DNA-binding transcriptional LysR family regulator
MRTLRRALRYFETVARDGSVRGAAERLHITASAISRAVQQLETEIGVPLFDRTARGLHLTVAGETLLAFTRRWERDTAQLTTSLRSLTGTQVSAVSVASVEVACYQVLPGAAAALRQTLPGLQVKLMVGDTGTVLESVANGSAEFGVAINVAVAHGAPVRTVFSVRNPVGLVVPSAHPLASRAGVRLADVLREPVVLPDEGLAARSAIRRVLDAAGAYSLAASSNRIAAVKSLVQAGLGPTFLTRLDVSAEEAAGLLRFVPLEDRDVEHPFVSIVAPRGSTLSAAADLYVEAVKKVLGAGAEGGR